MRHAIAVELLCWPQGRAVMPGLIELSSESLAKAEITASMVQKEAGSIREYGCRMDTWSLRRLAAKLVPLGPAGAWEILKKLENGGSQGKAQGEIVNPGKLERRFNDSRRIHYH